MLLFVCLVYSIVYLNIERESIYNENSNELEGPKTNLKKTTTMVLAVALHNIPEGMAIGVVYAGLIAGDSSITAMGALALSIGIAIQNFPEGAAISISMVDDLPFFVVCKITSSSFIH